ncbi:MAG: hypothetical protein IT424_01435 [Pirellulales bacterium]|nr:hypothetical protein [Pirellulales bacterium]
MRRLPTFIFGMITGGLLIYVALNYHLINAPDGLHLVPKLESTLAATYVDVRSFGPTDWAQHPDVAMALLHAQRTDLIGSAARESVWNGVDKLLPPPSESR